MRTAVSSASTLRDFYSGYFLPICLSESQPRTREAYEGTLDKWDALTDNPPLDRIGPDTLATFRDRIKQQRGKRSATISPNTVRKHLRHLQSILDKAGPPARHNRDAAGLLDRPPWIRPPREIIRQPGRAADTPIVALYQSTAAATFPLGDIPPAAWWRAALSTILSTSLRIGQILEMPNDAVDWQTGRLHLPAEISRKSCADQELPLHPLAFRDLFAIRGDRQLLFPFPHSRTTLYAELRRIHAAAGTPPNQQFAFHQMRHTTLTAVDQVAPEAAQMMAGHKSYGTTVRHYLALDKLIDAVERMPLLAKLQRTA